MFGEIKEENAELLRKGIELDDGMTLPANVKILRRERGKTELLVAIREGRNRQVRRMLDKINHPVITLRREKIGALSLGNLKLGEYRELTNEEINYLYSL